MIDWLIDHLALIMFVSMFVLVGSYLRISPNEAVSKRHNHHGLGSWDAQAESHQGNLCLIPVQ